MIEMSLSRIADVTHGVLSGGNPLLTRVCTDTRKILPGDLYVALRGEHFDGNQFIDAAAAAGAAASVSNVASDALPNVQVANSYAALGLIARENRRAFSGPLIAITGSSGKTSTKEMLASILRQCGSVYATIGNLNNEVGVPLSLLALTDEHDFAVIEMGAAKRGDIQYLCEFAEPDIAILTNAQPAHIEGFKSLQGVVETKGEIFSALGQSGVAVINADDPHCGVWQTMAGAATQALFSTVRTDVDVYATDIRAIDDGSSYFTLHCPAGLVEVHLPLPGRHMVANALAATAAAMATGASLAQVAAGLSATTNVAGRLSMKTLGGVTIIDDSYNANPGSVRAAIEVLGAYPSRKILVLGAMAELGDLAEQLHCDIAAFARDANVDAFFVCGKYADAMAQTYGECAFSFPDRDALGSALGNYIRSGDTVLLKGSRSAGMEHVVTRLSQILAEGGR